MKKISVPPKQKLLLFFFIQIFFAFILFYINTSVADPYMVIDLLKKFISWSFFTGRRNSFWSAFALFRRRLLLLESIVDNTSWIVFNNIQKLSKKFPLFFRYLLELIPIKLIRFLFSLRNNLFIVRAFNM